VPGQCYGNGVCEWDETTQLELVERDLMYTPHTDTYEWLLYLPESVQAGSHYLLSIYGYDHWNLHVSESLPGMIISIEDHPIPDGTNLYDMYGAPNCESDCDYYSDEAQFLALLTDQDYTKREKLWHF
jgi:hypothetical protein